MKKCLALLLVFVLCAALVPVSALAANNGKAIQLGTAPIEDPVARTIRGNTVYNPSSYVYYGSRNWYNPIKWRVLDADKNNAGGDGMFLLSENLLASSVSYSGWCSDVLDDFFNTQERNSILAVNKSGVSSETVYGERWKTSALSNAKLFFPSVRELSDYVANYERGSGLAAEHTNGNEDSYWLRSAGTSASSYQSGSVDRYGDMALRSSTSQSKSARPALNINRNSVLLTSDARVGKDYFIYGRVAKIPTTTTKEWKFTLLDNSASSPRKNFSVTEKNVTAAVGGTIELSYSGAAVGPNEYISVIFADAGGAQYYGRILKPVRSSGTVRVELPDDLARGSYTMYVFSEQYNGDQYTDLASPFSEVTVNVASMHTVIWQNWDGTELEKDENVPYGTEPVYNGAEPTRADDAQYSYTFAGWDPAVSDVTGNVTYKATFTSSTNTYTVIWQNWDGAELEKDENVPYGTEPVYNGAEPTRADDAQYSYTFAGWDPAVSDVTGNVTYKATFTSNTNTYTVIWQNWDGAELEKDENVPYGTEPVYNGAEPTRADDAQYSYTFAGWDPAVSDVTGDVIYKATFTSTPIVYVVHYAANGGVGTMSSQTLVNGALDQYLSTNTFTREGFTFIGWNTAADGSGESYANGAVIAAAFNGTLYAQWQENPVVNPLQIIKHPTDQYVQEGQRAEFSVEATGDGLTYQWYINRNKSRSWTELEGAVGDVYITSVTDLECDGFQYACLVSDQHGNSLRSDVAVLHVSQIPALPETGDSANTALWLAMGVLSLVGIALLWKKSYSR